MRKTTKKKNTNPQVSSTREVFSVFVERYGHDPVCGVEGLLHSIAVVNVDIYVQDPLVIPTQNQKQNLKKYAQVNHGFN